MRSIKARGPAVIAAVGPVTNKMASQSIYRTQLSLKLHPLYLPSTLHTVNQQLVAKPNLRNHIGIRNPHFRQSSLCGNRQTDTHTRPHPPYPHPYPPTHTYTHTHTHGYRNPRGLTQRPCQTSNKQAELHNLTSTLYWIDQKTHSHTHMRMIKTGSLSRYQKKAIRTIN